MKRNLLPFFNVNKTQFIKYQTTVRALIIAVLVYLYTGHALSVTYLSGTHPRPYDYCPLAGYDGIWSYNSGALQSCKQSSQNIRTNSYCGVVVYEYITPAPSPNHIYDLTCHTRSACPDGYVGESPNCIRAGSGKESNIGGSCLNTNRPINIPTGNKFFQISDYRDNDFSFTRSYNSIAGRWVFEYQQRLIIQSDLIVVERPDGKLITFSVNGGVFSPNSQRREQLSVNNGIYTLTLPNNRYETYDTAGRLLSIDTLYDDTISLSYDTNSITVNKNDQQIILTTNSANHITQAVFPDATSVTYSYVNILSSPMLSSATHSDTSMRRYFYEDTRFPTYITGIEDENGNRISSVQYDDEGRAISSERGPLNSGVERTQIQYNSDGTRTLTNALGKQSTYHFTQFNGEYKMTQVEGHPSANCAGANKNYTYDTNGFMASKTDWKGNATTYINNDRGQVLSRTEASGTPQARTITTEWHADYNLPTKITEPSRVTDMTYDANGRLLSRTITDR